MKKRIISLLLGALLSLSVVGCGQAKKQITVSENSNDKNTVVTPTGMSETSENQVMEEKLKTEEKQELDKDEGKLSEENKNQDAVDSMGNSEELPKVVEELVYSENFEESVGNFLPRGDEVVEQTGEVFHTGKASLCCSNRKQTWHGPSIDLTKYLKVNQKYTIKAYVKYGVDSGQKRVYAKIEQNGNQYLSFGSVLASNGEWVLLEGSIQIPPGTTKANLYFESEYNTSAKADDLQDIYVDDIEIYEVRVEGDNKNLPNLCEIYENDFKIGVAINGFELKEDKRVQLITTQFNSMTMGNEMKPENILDYQTCAGNVKKYQTEPALSFSRLDIGMKFALEHELAMRGHTLLWHQQTPRWFFTENYSKDPNAPLASEEIMTKRLESYIKQVLTYCNENYPGLIYAWDVVNEAMNPEDGIDGGYRSKDSYWYQIFGNEYIELAFTYARKYAGEGVALFYNDYNCYDKSKLFAIYQMAEGLVEKGILDGIGMQSHIQMTYPSMADYEYAIKKYASLGVEVQITELDINLDSNTAEDLIKLGTRYKKLFSLYQRLKQTNQANITSVTLWGLSDEYSWLNRDKRKYPLLFDDNLIPKTAFYGACLSESIPLY